MIRYLIIGFYFMLMILVGVFSASKIKSNKDYYIASKKGNFWQITGSLIATIIGSSAILGTCDLARFQGWAASWFLISAALGLFLLVPLSHLVRKNGRYTLPQMIEDFYGKEAKSISSLIISVAWIGIIGAQIIGAARVLQGFTGLDYAVSAWISGLVFIFYTIIGGQISVIRTDLFQSVIILAGTFMVAMFLLMSEKIPQSPMTNLSFPFNKGFQPFDLLVLFLTHSTTYVVGPDIYSRIFCSGSKTTARKSVLWTAIILIPFSLCITFIGVYSSWKFPQDGTGSALIPVMVNTLPDWGIGLFIAALLSAVMSSASATLLTSSLIIGDLTTGNLDSKIALRTTKIIMLLIGLLSIVISLRISSIIQSLLIALSFFAGAFIVPVLAGLMGFRTNNKLVTTAIIIGGLISLTGKIYTIYGNAMIGNVIIISAFLVNAAILFSGNYAGTIKIKGQS